MMSISVVNGFQANTTSLCSSTACLTVTHWVLTVPRTPSWAAQASAVAAAASMSAGAVAAAEAAAALARRTPPRPPSRGSLGRDPEQMDFLQVSSL